MMNKILISRYILYGKEGCGKSLTLAHLICYGYQENFVVMSFAWVSPIININLTNEKKNLLIQG